jgi:hypothetical protein
MNGKCWTLMLALLFTMTTALAQDGRVTILSPADGATLDPAGPQELTYEVDPGPRGHHVHIYVDDREIGIIRALKGSFLLKDLPAGDRNICIKVVNRAHTPVGIDGCVKVHVQPGMKGMDPPASGQTDPPTRRRYGY